MFQFKFDGSYEFSKGAIDGLNLGVDTLLFGLCH